jgi:RimJ/RimL family protein N-acetyltransferase
MPTTAPPAPDALPATELELPDGARVLMRPLGPGDRRRLEDAFARLGPRSRHLRFLGPKPALAPRELTALTELDHVRDDALAAIDAADGRLVAVARYASFPGRIGHAEVAVAVVDDWQRRGLGTQLTAALLRRAVRHGVARLSATTLAENRGARALVDALGFRLAGRCGAVLEFALDLPAQSTSARRMTSSPTRRETTIAT